MNVIKKILVAGIISLFVPASSFAEKVKIGDPGWTGATAIANLLAAVVIDKMGGEAELVPGNNTAIYGAIDISIAPYIAVLFPGTNSASPPILSMTTAASKFAIAVAPVQPGSPIFTFSAKLEAGTNNEIIPATRIFLITFIFSSLD